MKNRTTVWKRLAPFITAALFTLGTIQAVKLVCTENLADEEAYILAAEAIHAGRSPYTVKRYLYPPNLALAGAAILSVTDEISFKVGLRTLSILMGIAAIWIALGIIERRPRFRLLLTALLVLLWPPFSDGLRVGNISPLITGMILIAVAICRSKPPLAGLLLATAVSIKPIGAAALPILLISLLKSRERNNDALRFAIAAGAGLLAFLVLGYPYFSDMLAVDQYQIDALGNISFTRLFHFFDLEISPVIPWFLAVTAGMAFVWRTEPDTKLLMSATTCFALLSAPVVWQHTLLLALPLQVSAVDTALTRFRRNPSLRQLTEILFVIAGVSTVVFAEDYGAFTMLPTIVQAFFISLPLAAMVGLLFYVKVHQINS